MTGASANSRSDREGCFPDAVAEGYGSQRDWSLPAPRLRVDLQGEARLLDPELRGIVQPRDHRVAAGDRLDRGPIATEKLEAREVGITATPAGLDLPEIQAVVAHVGEGVDVRLDDLL